ncbi:MAG: hypothetical protein GX369_01300 [Euryarchaeota archaeon]|nr:hypothetical protein [Euryarchaeota archaeon]
MNSSNALKMVDSFTSTYVGIFGAFTKDGESSITSASALAPDGDSMSIVRFEIVDNAISDFINRKAFIESKQKRLDSMGKMQPFDYTYYYDESFGRVLNFDLLGKTGGFLFYTAYREEVLVFIQAYSTTGKGQISELECKNIVEAAYNAI